MPVKPHLSATITNFTLTINGTRFPSPNFSIPNYGGFPWYCHAQSNGKTLSVLIDDNPGPAPGIVPQLAPATSADVTIALGNAVLQNVSFSQVNYQGNPLNLVMRLDSSLQTAAFFVDDGALGKPGPLSATLEFVLVQEQPLGPYRIGWLQPDSFITIENANTLADGSVVLPPPLQAAQNVAVTPAGVLGPMGFSTP